MKQPQDFAREEGWKYDGGGGGGGGGVDKAASVMYRLVLRFLVDCHATCISNAWLSPVWEVIIVFSLFYLFLLLLLVVVVVFISSSSLCYQNHKASAAENIYVCTHERENTLVS